MKKEGEKGRRGEGEKGRKGRRGEREKGRGGEENGREGMRYKEKPCDFVCNSVLLRALTPCDSVVKPTSNQ